MDMSIYVLLTAVSFAFVLSRVVGCQSDAMLRVVTIFAPKAGNNDSKH
jgi:hypothetical protein